MAGVSTEDPAAYFAYLRGLSLRRQLIFSKVGLQEAVRMMEYAVKKDAGFIEAHAELVRLHAKLYFNGDWSESRHRAARDALQQARDLNAEHHAVRLATFYYSYQVKEDYGLAITRLPGQIHNHPGAVEFLHAKGLVKRRQGDSEAAVALFAEAFSLAHAECKLPMDGSSGGEGVAAVSGATLAREIAITFRALRRYEEADRWYRVAVDMTPDDHMAVARRASNIVAWKGDGADASDALREARLILSNSPLLANDSRLYRTQLRLDLYEATLASPRAAMELYSRIAERIRETPGRSGGPKKGAQAFFLEVLAYERLGQQDMALNLIHACRQKFEERVRIGNDFPFFQSLLGIAYAYLGLREAAIDASESAAARVPNDRFDGPRLHQRLAVTLVRLGEHERAIELLESLLKTSYQSAINPVILRLDPVWDPLRGHPNFERLVR